MAITKVTGAGISDAINNAIDANTAKVTNTTPTKADIDALGIAASSITGALPAIDGSSLTGIEIVTKSATAPSSPSAGDMWFDTTTGTTAMKVWSGSDWDQMSNKFSAIGGTETTYSSGGTNYKVHTFTSSGTFTAEDSGSVDYLVVAGGGSGNNGYINANHISGGGGGAGGYLAASGVIAAGAHTVTVGAGGAWVNVEDSSPSGSNSTFGSFNAIGGGGGGKQSRHGADGGSGGGGGGNSNGGSGTTGQGNAGSTGGPDSTGGGGGGAGGAGSAPTRGAGLASSITGSSVTRALGGTGGTSGNGTAGSSNTGNGGGGAGPGSSLVGRNGGSGIVIIRYVV